MNTLNEAIELYQQERYRDAVHRLRLVTEFAPDNVEGWMYFGAALGKLGEWEAAVHALRQVVRLRPDQITGYCDLAAALLEAGDARAAEATMAQAAGLDRDHPALRELRRRVSGVSRPAPTPDPLPAASPSPRAARRRRRAWPRVTLPPLRGLITDRNRLPLMLVVLAVLIVLTVLKVARAPGTGGEAARAIALLRQADEQEALLRVQRGEDFDIKGQARQLRDGAYQIAKSLLDQDPHLPEAHWVLARVALAQRDPLGAKSDSLKGLAELDDTTGALPRPSGVSADELRSGLLRTKVRALLSGGSLSPAQAAAAHADLQTATQLAPEQADADLGEQLRRLGG
jgi:tetratricopeptide (TPR) repeat protein